MDEDNINTYEERRKKVYEFICDKDYKPMRRKDIAAILQVPSGEMHVLSEILDELESDGKIVCAKGSRYFTAESLDQHAGEFSGSTRGYGFVRTEDMPDDVYIPSDCVNGAVHKDKVMFVITERFGKHAEGRIIRVLSHGVKHIVGTYRSSGDYSFVVPDDRRFGDNIYIPPDKAKGASDGLRVLVSPEEYSDGCCSNKGEITEIIGNADDPGTDILTIIMKHDLPYEFSDEVMQYTKCIPDSTENEDLSDREDFRNVQMVTIDGEDAKDLDDAVSVKKLEDGTYRLGVYIADVSHYVKEGSPLDEEALERGTSVYPVDRVVPMLPPKLSNGICSLNAHEDRLCLCCIMTVDRKGDVISHDIKKGIINVDRRMSYTVVYDLLTNENSEYKEEYSELIPMFREMEELRNILYEKRRKRGAIDIESDEAKIILDENGKPTDIVRRERNVATSIIEEFMIAANETVAEHFYWLETPFVYRIHEKPDEEKYENLKALVAPLGYVMKGSSQKPKSYQQLLDKAKERPEGMFIHRLALRSMKRAAYTAEQGPHFGLASEYYCHFTSPIRRYPDLQIHRIISEYIDGKLDEKRIAHYNRILPEIAESCSEKERRADEAEREAAKCKMAQYMKDKSGTFKGFISGIRPWGIYVELENTVEGMISFRNTDEHFTVDEEKMCCTSQSGTVYKVGDTVEVRLINVNLRNYTIDFIFEDDFTRIPEEATNPY